MTSQEKSTPATMTTSWVVILLALMMGMQAVATDLYLPALPEITQRLGFPSGDAQYTLTGMLLAFGLSQLAWGPVSDRFGRKPILLGGLFIISVAAVLASVANNLTELVTARCIQGVGLGAVVMCGRAMIRDLYEPNEGAKVMSLGLTGLGVLASISPSLGGILAESFGWRSTLLTLGIFSGMTLVLAIWKFKETLSHPNPDSLKILPQIKIWHNIGFNRHFQTYAGVCSASYGGLFTFLATSPFVFIQVFELTPRAFALVMFIQSVSYTMGTFICRALLKRWGVNKTVRAASLLSLSSGTSLVSMSLLGIHSATSVLLCYLGFVIAHGIHQPCGQSGAVAPFPRTAGAASALTGCIMMGLAFLTGLWLANNMDANETPLTYSIGFWSLVVTIIAWGPLPKTSLQSQLK